MNPMSTAVDTGLPASVVAEYLDRVGLTGERSTLSELAPAHVTAIPFENVDVVLRRHRGIGLDAVVDTIIRRRRGGYCYEHAPPDGRRAGPTSGTRCDP